MPLRFFSKRPREPRDTTEGVARVLIGQSLRIERPDVSADWRFICGSGHFLSAGSWRLLDDTRIVVAVEDDGQFFGLSKPVDVAHDANLHLDRVKIDTISVEGRSGDLSLGFDSGLELQLLVWSRGYECWHLHGPPPQCELLALGANGGGF